MWWTRTHRVVRPVASTTLAVLATLLLFPSIITNWARTNLYDTETFADHAEAALEDDAVRATLIRAIVDRLVELGPPEALSIRPLLELVTATVVDTQAFLDIYRESVEQMHRDVFQGDDGKTPVALTLVDAMIVITAMVEQAYPEVAEQLPAQPTEAFIRLRERDWTITAVTFGEDVEQFAYLFPALSIVLYGAALAVSPNRRSTLAAIGFGWVTVAALLVVGREYAEGVVLDQAAFENRAVGEAIWDAYTSSLTAWAFLIGGLGLSVAIVATGTRRRVDVSGQFDAVRKALARRPDTAAGRVARAASFVAVGVLVAWQSTEALQVAAVMAGAYAVYYGISELIWLAGPGATGSAVSQRQRRAPEVGRLALRSGAVGALVLAAAGGVFISWEAVETAGGRADNTRAPARCNGYEELCNRRLDQVTFLGSHNAMAAVESGWYFAEQLSDIEGQLDSGIRALLLDSWYGYPTDNGVRTADRDLVEATLPPGEYREDVLAAARRLQAYIGEPETGQEAGSYLCHAFCELGATPLVEALISIDTFLAEHPGEVMFIIFQDQISPDDTAKAFITSGLMKRVYWPQPGRPFPTLGEMVERNQRVVVLADNDAAGIDWYQQAWDVFQETPFTVPAIEQLSCAPGRGGSENPLFALNHWLSGSFPSVAMAREMNSFDLLYGRAQECGRERGRVVNLLNLNFAEIGDGLRVVDALNGVGETAGEDQ